MSTSITKRIEFDAAHRLLNHGGKCQNLHGHRYAAEFTFWSDYLDPVGRVLDFDDVKQSVGKRINDALDHGYIAQSEEDMVVGVCRAIGSKCFIMPDNAAPTAENLAELLLVWAKQAVSAMLAKLDPEWVALQDSDKERPLRNPRQLMACKVTVYETPTSSATVNYEPCNHARSL